MMMMIFREESFGHSPHLSCTRCTAAFRNSCGTFSAAKPGSVMREPSASSRFPRTVLLKVGSLSWMAIMNSPRKPVFRSWVVAAKACRGIAG